MTGMSAFAAIPVPAIGDRRLKGLHLRALAAVAVHDRFGKNGVGCVASLRTLAAEIGCHYVNLSARLAELVAWGYVVAAELPSDRRRREYRVRYGAAGAASKWGGIPERAIGDRRLKGLHLHALADVALHDRFGTNGFGCLASLRTLAVEIGCNYSNLSGCLAELASWGYLVAAELPLDRRRHAYCVAYAVAAPAPEATETPADLVCPQANENRADDPGKADDSALSSDLVCPQANETDKVVSPDFCQVADFPRLSGKQYIPRSGVHTFLSKRAHARAKKGAWEQGRQRHLPLMRTLAGGKGNDCQDDQDLAYLDREIVTRIETLFGLAEHEGWSRLPESDADLARLRRLARQGRLTDAELRNGVFGGADLAATRLAALAEPSEGPGKPMAYDAPAASMSAEQRSFAEWEALAGAVR